VTKAGAHIETAAAAVKRRPAAASAAAAAAPCAPARRPPGARRSWGLSARILLLSIAFLLLGEILIFLPSIARFRLVYLQEIGARAHLATLPLDRSGTVPVPMEIEDALLSNVGALRIQVIRPEGELVLGPPVPVDRTFDLASASWLELILDALETLRFRGERLIRIRLPAEMEAGAEVVVTLPEAALWYEMVGYARRILLLSLVLSAFLATLLFLALRRTMIAPLERITAHLHRFRRHPEDAAHDLEPSGRSDEIGIVEAEIAAMQKEIRRALLQKTRLAALGAAVARIQHDLKNMLAGAILISDRLEASGDPRVREIAGRLLATLERAARLCTETLTFAKSELPTLEMRPLPLREPVLEAGATLAPGMRLEMEIPDGLEVCADRDRLYRVFLNLFKNAEQATGGRGTIWVRAWLEDGGRVAIEVADDGPGIPEQVRSHLFEPFAAAPGKEGVGLGLAICREIMRAHGGDIRLVASGEGGTRFRLHLPVP